MYSAPQILHNLSRLQAPLFHLRPHDIELLELSEAGLKNEEDWRLRGRDLLHGVKKSVRVSGQYGIDDLIGRDVTRVSDNIPHVLFINDIPAEAIESKFPDLAA